MVLAEVIQTTKGKLNHYSTMQKGKISLQCRLSLRAPPNMHCYYVNGKLQEQIQAG